MLRMMVVTPRGWVCVCQPAGLPGASQPRLRGGDQARWGGPHRELLQHVRSAPLLLQALSMWHQVNRLASRRVTAMCLEVRVIWVFQFKGVLQERD
jgi:hypothetical protein